MATSLSSIYGINLNPSQPFVTRQGFKGKLKVIPSLKIQAAMPRHLTKL